MPDVAFLVAMLAIIVFVVEWAHPRGMIPLGLALFVVAFVLTFVVQSAHGVRWTW